MRPSAETARPERRGGQPGAAAAGRAPLHPTASTTGRQGSGQAFPVPRSSEPRLHGAATLAPAAGPRPGQAALSRRGCGRAPGETGERAGTRPRALRGDEPLAARLGRSDPAASRRLVETASPVPALPGNFSFSSRIKVAQISSFFAKDITHLHLTWDLHAGAAAGRVEEGSRAVPASALPTPRTLGPGLEICTRARARVRGDRTAGGPRIRLQAAPRHRRPRGPARTCGSHRPPPPASRSLQGAPARTRRLLPPGAAPAPTGSRV